MKTRLPLVQYVCKQCLARESFIHYAEREHILLILLMKVGLQDISVVEVYFSAPGHRFNKGGQPNRS